MTLIRHPDPEPEEWLYDTGQIMRSSDWYGFEHFGWAYGNFWAPEPCPPPRSWSWRHPWSKPSDRPHDWRVLARTPLGDEPGGVIVGYHRVIHRCRHCGSQVHMGCTVTPPAYGRL